MYFNCCQDSSSLPGLTVLPVPSFGGKDSTGQVQEKVPAEGREVSSVRGSRPHPSGALAQPQAHPLREQGVFKGTGVPCPSPPLGHAVQEKREAAFRSLWQGRGQRGVVKQRIPDLHLSGLCWPG